MRITFDLPDSTAGLLKLSAERVRLNYPKIAEQSLSDIAKALVQEVLIDDAEAHGIVMLSLFDGRSH